MQLRQRKGAAAIDTGVVDVSAAPPDVKVVTLTPGDNLYLGVTLSDDPKTPG